MFYTAIPDPVASLLRGIKSFPLPQGTYLAGGTALALYYGHRLSIDIDLFTPGDFLSGPIVEAIKKGHKFIPVQVNERDTFVVQVDGVQFRLFTYPYPLLQPLVHESQFDMDMASLIDIAAMKTAAIAQRGSAKDFVDLKTIIEAQRFSAEELIRLANKKYGTSEEYTYHHRKSLVYFDDAEKVKHLVTLIINGQPVKLGDDEWKKVKDFFCDIVLPRE